MSLALKKALRHKLAKSHPETNLGKNGWKIDKLAKDHYSSFKQTWFMNKTEERRAAKRKIKCEGDTDMNSNSNWEGFNQESSKPITKCTKWESSDAPFIMADDLTNFTFIGDESITSPTIVDESIASQIAVDKPILSQIAMDKSVVSPTIVNKSVASQIAVDKSVISPTIVGEPIPSETTVDKSFVSLTIIDEPFPSPMAAENLIVSPTITDKPIPSPITANESVTSPSTMDKPITTESRGLFICIKNPWGFLLVLSDNADTYCLGY